MSDQLLKNHGLWPIDVDVLSVINDLGFASTRQVASILLIDNYDVRQSITRLIDSNLVVSVGRPMLYPTHPLFSNYYACKRSNLGDKLLPNHYRWVRASYSRDIEDKSNSHGILFPSKTSVGTAYYFSNHSTLINYAAAWIVKTAFDSLGWSLFFEGEQRIRSVRKWHYGRIITLAERGAGTAISVPDFILIRKQKLLCCEVELSCKTVKYYRAYYDHVERDFSILYIVPSRDVGKKIMASIPVGSNSDYVVFTDNDGLIRTLPTLFPD